jgi:uracil-DNA glycosylase
MNSELDNLKENVKSCCKCKLSQNRNNVVFGEGNFSADILLIGEAPGINEDKEGRPFVGKAGKFLDELLNSAEIKRSEVFIANILKCRPPQNRNPTSEEIRNCTIFLDRQIELINPKVICTLGNFSTKYILEKFGLEKEIDGISKLHGKIFKINTILGTIKIIPLYHPAVAIYNANMKDILTKDFKIVKENI